MGDSIEVRMAMGLTEQHAHGAEDGRSGAQTIGECEGGRVAKPSVRSSDGIEGGRAPKKGGFHYAYLIVLAGIVITCVPCACALSCAGIFFTPVSDYFGVSKAQVSLYFSILNLAMMFTLPVAGNLMEKLDLRIVLSVCVAIDGLSFLAMSQFGAVWMFYIAGVFLGIGTAPLIYLAVPTLVSNWCVKNVGFFIGLCMAFTGIGGVVLNPVGTAFINSGVDGWRMGYIAFGVLCLVIALPFTLFVVRSHPADKGLEPFGAGDASLAEEADRGASHPVMGVSASVALKSLAFAALAVYAFLITANQQVYQFFASYCQSFEGTGIALAAGAVAGACMAGQAVAKVVLGVINDKSVPAGLVSGIVCGVVGIALMWAIPAQIAVLLAGAFLFGFAYALNAVQIPMLARAAFGQRDYLAIYSKLAMASALGGVIATTLWGVLVDLPNGYSLLFGASIAVMLACAALGLMAVRRGGKLERTAE
jgi:MFS family permease